MNKTTATSIHDFKHLSRRMLAKSWFKFFIKITIITGIGFLFLYFFGTYIPIIMTTILVLIGLGIRLKHLQRLKYLNELKIPNYIWVAFKKRHPSISVSQHSHIEEGFKDYLALHLWKRGSYAMPSHSVDALWHLLIEEYGGFYLTLCQNILGYELIHKPHDKEPTEPQKASQKKQLANTWQAACAIHGLNPQNTQILPRLFQVDAHVRWENGLVFTIPFMVAMYAQMFHSASETPYTSTTSSCSSSTTACSSNSSSACSGSSSSSESSHSSDSSSSDSSSSFSSCSSCGGGGGD